MRSEFGLRFGCLLACVTAVAGAQTSVDRSFKSVANNCQDIQWSDKARQMYPTIAAACQSVEEREGKKYVKFQGTVERVANGGQQLVVDFKDGGEITLSPPPETNFYVDGRRTKAAQLQRGDALNFYIAEDRLAAQFPENAETDVVNTRFVVVPIVMPEVRDEQVAATLPATASALPLLGLGGVVFLSLGAMLRYRRKR
jgi:LPXTG-motif cell wall-anchored protein